MAKRGRKYVTGDVIHYMNELAVLLDLNRWLYLRGVVKHPSIFKHMTYATLELLVSNGVIQRAERAEGEMDE